MTISLIYPHLRAGTLPLSGRTRALFPTAWESPRVRFTLVDARSGIKMPAWVVRENRYAFGLRDWYKSHQLIPGSLVSVREGHKPGEVIVEAKTQRSSKDWIRTLIVGADGGLVFAMLKQPITAEFNDRMAIYVADFHSLDPLWEKKAAIRRASRGRNARTDQSESAGSRPRTRAVRGHQSCKAGAACATAGHAGHRTAICARG